MQDLWRNAFIGIDGPLQGALVHPLCLEAQMVKALFLALLLGLMVLSPAHATLELATYGAGSRTCADFLDVLEGMNSKPTNGYCEQLIDPVDATSAIHFFRNWTWGFLSGLDMYIQTTNHLVAGLNTPPVDGLSSASNPRPIRTGMFVFNSWSPQNQKHLKTALWNDIVRLCKQSPEKTYGAVSLEAGSRWLNLLK